MRWIVLELLDRRQEKRDEVLVHWACSWITREECKNCSRARQDASFTNLVRFSDVHLLDCLH